MEITQLGEFRLTSTGERRAREGQTAKKASSTGTAEIWLLEGHTVALELGVTNWLNGDREVSCLSRLTSPEPMDRLTRGMRLGIDLDSADRYRLRMRTPRIGARDWPTLHGTSIHELDRLTKLDVRALLLTAGAVAVDVGSRVIRSPSRRSSDLYVLFRDGAAASAVPALAYSLAVAIPMYVQFGNG